MVVPLQRVLFVDFIGALATVLVLLIGAAPLGPHLGLTPTTLRIAGVVLVPFVLFVLSTARSSPVSLPRARFIVAFNIAWFFASLLFLALANLSSFGAWLITLQALLVVPLVTLERRALRHQRHTLASVKWLG